MMKDQRPEGVYCRWETYPPDSGLSNNILTMERVNGDCTVSSFSCTREEAGSIHSFLARPARSTNERIAMEPKTRIELTPEVAVSLMMNISESGIFHLVDTNGEVVELVNPRHQHLPPGAKLVSQEEFDAATGKKQK